MRRLLIVLALNALLAGPAHALDWAIGAQAIGSSHSLTGDLPDEGDWKGQYSGGAGLLFDLSFTSDITLSVQPSWMPRRCKQQFEERGVVTGESKFDFEYLVVPLLVRVDSAPRKVQGFVTAGLSLGYLLDARLDDGSGTIDISDTFDEFSMGALFGAGVIVGVGKQRLIFELRYEQGLDDILRERGAPMPLGAATAPPSIKYREIKIVAGILFGTGGRR